MKVEHALDKETILQQLEDVRAKQVYAEWRLCQREWHCSLQKFVP